MKYFILIISTVLLISACKEDKGVPTPEAAPTAIYVNDTAITRNEFVSLKPFVITDKNNIEVLRLDASHNVWVKGIKRGMLDDGEILDENSNVVAKISILGIITGVSGEPMAKINDKYQLDHGSGNFISISNDGKLINGAKDSGWILNPNSPNSFKTALFLSYWFLYR